MTIPPLLMPYQRHKFRVSAEFDNVEYKDICMQQTVVFEFDLVKKEILWTMRHPINLHEDSLYKDLNMKPIFKKLTEGLASIQLEFVDDFNSPNINKNKQCYIFKNLRCKKAFSNFDYGTGKPVHFDFKFKFEDYE